MGMYGLLILALTVGADGFTTWNPPEKYDYQFEGELFVYKLEQPQVVIACKKLFELYDLDIEVTSQQKGCAVRDGNSGIIIMIDEPYENVLPDAVFRHEQGHLNGWPSDHPEH